MSIFLLSLKNILYRPLQSVLSLLILSLGVGLISTVLQIEKQVEQQLQGNLKGIDMVVGAKGSPLQLILSAVLQLDNPTGNIPLTEANRITNHPLVKYTVPLSYGDNYKGYRVLGTDTAYLSLYGGRLAQGAIWRNDMEVVLGADIARNLGLKVGDHFHTMHGLSEDGHHHDEEAYTIVGVLQPTGTVLDRLLLCSTASVWAVHQKEGQEVKSIENQSITALLVKFKSPAGMIMLPRLINEKTSMQAAVPSYQINRLLGLMGIGIEALELLAVIIMLVSGISVFISLYNALKERVYELALMRTYGASQWQLSILLLSEGLALIVAGFVLGIAFSRISLWLFTVCSSSQYASSLSVEGLLWPELWLLAFTLVLGVLSAALPAIKAMRIDISSALQKS